MPHIPDEHVGGALAALIVGVVIFAIAGVHALVDREDISLVQRATGEWPGD